MNFKHILFVLVSVAHIQSAFPFPYEVIVNAIKKGTIQAGSNKTSEYIKIMTFPDCHTKKSSNRHHVSLMEQEQITSLIRYFQEHKNFQSFHIFIEQPSEINKSLPINKSFASGYEMLFTLDKHIKEAHPPLTHVMLDNIEMRYVAGPAMDLLHNYVYYADYLECKTDDAKKIIGTITFQDVLDEFDQIRQSLATYYLNHPNPALVALYADYMKTAERYCEQLKYKISNLNETVLAYAKARYYKRSDQVSQIFHEQEDDMMIMPHDIKLSFTHLFDLNLLKNIFTSKSHNILVFAGGDHTRELITMLNMLKAMTIYEIRNVVIKPILQKNGFTRNEEVLSPVTGEQIMQAFAAHPVVLQGWKTGSPLQVVFASAIMSTIVYWLYAKYKATDEENVQEDDGLDGNVAEDTSKVECSNEAVA